MRDVDIDFTSSARRTACKKNIKRLSQCEMGTINMGGVTLSETLPRG